MSVAIARDIIRDVVNIQSLARNLNAMNPHRERLARVLTEVHDAAFDALAAEEVLRHDYQSLEEQRA